MLLVGLGGVTARTLADAGQALRDALGLRTLAGPSLDRPAYALNGPRGQYHASAVVRRLASLRGGAGGAVVLGIVDVDLFEPDDEADFVIVEVDREAGAAVVSIARLATRDEARLRRRVQAEVVHAAARLAGRSRCPDRRCALHPSADAADADAKEPALCAACRAAPIG